MKVELTAGQKAELEYLHRACVNAAIRENAIVLKLSFWLLRTGAFP